jgi:hypothetical protein
MMLLLAYEVKIWVQLLIVFTGLGAGFALGNLKINKFNSYLILSETISTFLYFQVEKELI